MRGGGSQPHSFNLVRHVLRNEFHGRMLFGINSKELIGECLSDFLDTVEVQEDRFEAVKSSDEALCLRSGNKLFVAVTCHFHWHYGF